MKTHWPFPLLVLLIALAFCQPANSREAKQPAESTSVLVEATGSGPTDSEAIKDALRSAVRQVVGAIVDAETLIKNDVVIADKVVTASNGLVSSYSEISSQREEGLVIKKIAARVERDRVAGQLKSSKVAIQDFQGQNLFARVVSQLEAEKEARQFIDHLLRDYPAKVLVGGLQGEAEVVSRSEEVVELRHRVTVEADQEKYEAFVARIRPVLERVAVRKGACVFDSKLEANKFFLPGFVPHGTTLVKLASDRPPPVFRISIPGLREDWWPESFDPREQMVLLLNTGGNKQHTRTVWAWYHVPRVEIPLRGPRLGIHFDARDGKAVRDDNFDFGANMPANPVDGFPLSHQRIAPWPPTGCRCQRAAIVG